MGDVEPVAAFELLPEKAVEAVDVVDRGGHGYLLWGSEVMRGWSGGGRTPSVM
ncbi:hypothetical protein [Rhodococcus opacus]|uniref:hypothetical protein n=1 Tax=Rhodococcus opacus TaxID=37919 RepID=UPI0002E6AD01|nr:hypothetical protein [Rhodococcus opacus]